MKFLEQLEKLAQKYKSTWGGDDAGELFCTMLEEGLAYGTKTEMVAIVPEQSVTQENEKDTVYLKDEITIPLNHGDYHNVKGLEVLLNGEKYSVNAVQVGNEYHFGAVWTDDFPDFSEFPFGIALAEYYEGDAYASIWWNKDLGETITLAIYEEQEVVKQIDPKFVGATPIIFTMNDETVTCNKTYTECIEMFENGSYTCFIVIAQGDGRIVTQNTTLEYTIPTDGSYPSIQLGYPIGNLIYDQNGSITFQPPG